MPTPDTLTTEITQALRQAAEQLFATQEHFYYLALCTTGEALQRVPAAQRRDVKWDLSSSPYFNFGAEYFDRVNRAFTARSNIYEMDEAASEQEFTLRLNAMTEALRRCDQQGIFARNQPRTEIVINVELLPPDETNTQRAKQLNPPEALTQWLAEAAE